MILAFEVVFSYDWKSTLPTKGYNNNRVNCLHETRLTVIHRCARMASS